jgi:hypothetical protein
MNANLPIPEKKVVPYEKRETPYIVPKNLHFLAVRTKFETFSFQIYFVQKRGNQLIRGKLSSLLYI